YRTIGLPGVAGAEAAEGGVRHGGGGLVRVRGGVGLGDYRRGVRGVGSVRRCGSDRGLGKDRSGGIGRLGDERSGSGVGGGRGCKRGVSGLGDHGGGRRGVRGVRGGLGDNRRRGVALSEERAGVAVGGGCGVAVGSGCGVRRLGQNRGSRVSISGCGGIGGLGEHWARVSGVSGFGDHGLCRDDGLGQGRRGVCLRDDRRGSGVADCVVLQQSVVAHVAVADTHGRVRGVLGPAVRGHDVLAGVALLRGLLAVADATVIGRQRADVIGSRTTGARHCHEGCEYYELHKKHLVISISNVSMLTRLNVLFCETRINSTSKYTYLYYSKLIIDAIFK
ncbi:hypothetical protein X777_12579, partial [Ooceraea biroi]